MINTMRETDTIVDAMHRIVKEKITLNTLLIRKIQEDRCYSSNYSARLVKILSKDYSKTNLPLAIEQLLSLEQLDIPEALTFLDLLLGDLYTIILVNKDFRRRYTSLMMVVPHLDWLAPLLVMTDYLQFFQDSSIDKIQS
jgi:hypothetical protein